MLFSFVQVPIHPSKGEEANLLKHGDHGDPGDQSVSKFFSAIAGFILHRGGVCVCNGCTRIFTPPGFSSWLAVLGLCLVLSDIMNRSADCTEL